MYKFANNLSGARDVGKGFPERTGRPEEKFPFTFGDRNQKMGTGCGRKTQGDFRTRRPSKGEPHDQRGQKELPCPRPGNFVSKAGIVLPGKPGLSVVSPVIRDDFKGIGSGEVQAGKDVGQKEGDLGKSQEGFFFENFSRIFWRKAWAMKTWSMWRCQPCQERCS